MVPTSNRILYTAARLGVEIIFEIQSSDVRPSTCLQYTTLPQFTKYSDDNNNNVPEDL